MSSWWHETNKKHSRWHLVLYTVHRPCHYNFFHFRKSPPPFWLCCFFHCCWLFHFDCVIFPLPTISDVYWHRFGFTRNDLKRSTYRVKASTHLKRPTVEPNTIRRRSSSGDEGPSATLIQEQVVDLSGGGEWAVKRTSTQVLHIGMSSFYRRGCLLS